MFGRITHFKADAARLGDMVSRIPAIRDEVSKIEGGVSNWAMWNDDGTGAAVAICEDAAAAEAAAPKIQAIWGELQEYLTEPPEIKSFGNAERTRN